MFRGTLKIWLICTGSAGFAPIIDDYDHIVHFPPAGWRPCPQDTCLDHGGKRGLRPLYIYIYLYILFFQQYSFLFWPGFKQDSGVLCRNKQLCNNIKKHKQEIHVFISLLKGTAYNGPLQFCFWSGKENKTLSPLRWIHTICCIETDSWCNGIIFIILWTCFFYLTYSLVSERHVILVTSCSSIKHFMWLLEIRGSVKQPDANVLQSHIHFLSHIIHT